MTMPGRTPARRALFLGCRVGRRPMVLTLRAIYPQRKDAVSRHCHAGTSELAPRGAKWTSPSWSRPVVASGFANARKGQEKGNVAVRPTIGFPSHTKQSGLALRAPGFRPGDRAGRCANLRLDCDFLRSSKLLILGELGGKKRMFGRGEWIRTTDLLVPNLIQAFWRSH